MAVDLDLTVICEPSLARADLVMVAVRYGMVHYGSLPPLWWYHTIPPLYLRINLVERQTSLTVLWAPLSVVGWYSIGTNTPHSIELGGNCCRNS